MNSTDRSGQVMRDVVAELRAEYLIGFVSPTKDGREHTMAVKSGRADFTVVAPSKFTAPK
jgi:hypothetical protein